MKRGILMLIFVLLLINLVSAININIKQEYKPGETLIGTLEGNFLSQLTPENFYFYSDREQIPLVFDIAKIQDKYYFYAILPAEERNYTLLIKDVKYYENARENIKDIEKNFSVLGNVSDFFVYPGFLIMRNSSEFFIESLSNSLAVSVKFLGSVQSVFVGFAQKKKISIEANISNFTLAEAEVSGLNTKYLIPVLILSKSNITGKNITETEKFRFSKSEYSFAVNKRNETIFKIYIQNLGNSEIKNINLNFSDTLQDTLKISPEEISSLPEMESKSIELIINAKTIKKYLGKITASSGNLSAETFIIINSYEENATLPAFISNNSGEISCSDLNGVLCLENQDCSGTSQETFEGLCCISGSCQEKKSYWGYIIGIIILIGVAAGLYYLYQRSKKAKISSEDIIKNRREKFEERINPKEITGSLTKT